MSPKEALAHLKQDQGEIRTLVREFERSGDLAKEQLVKRILDAALRAHVHRGAATL